MPRHGIAITVRHPRTGTLHFAGVEQGFGNLPAGTELPREAYARTLCRMPAVGWKVASFADRENNKFCGHCG